MLQLFRWSPVWLLCHPMEYRPTGSSVHGISQARILERVAISYCRGSSWPRNQTSISCAAGRFFTTEPPGKPIPGYQSIRNSKVKWPDPTLWMNKVTITLALLTHTHTHTHTPPGLAQWSYPVCWLVWWKSLNVNISNALTARHHIKCLLWGHFFFFLLKYSSFTVLC